MTNRIESIKIESGDLDGIRKITDQSQITDTYALYLDDESHSFEGATEQLIFPTTEEEIVAILRDAYEKGTPVTIQGGRTGLTGAAVPLGGIALNLEKMIKLLYMEYDESQGLYSIVAEPGALLEDLVLAAVNEAMDKAQELASQRLGMITGGMKIPGLM